MTGPALAALALAPAVLVRPGPGRGDRSADQTGGAVVTGAALALALAVLIRPAHALVIARLTGRAVLS